MDYLKKNKIFTQFITGNVIIQFKILLNITDTIFQEITPLDVSIFKDLISENDFNQFELNKNIIIGILEKKIFENYHQYYKNQYDNEVDNIDIFIELIFDSKEKNEDDLTFSLDVYKNILLERLKCDFEKQIIELQILKLAFNIIINSNKTKEYYNILINTKKISDCKWTETYPNGIIKGCLYQCYGNFCPFHF